MALPALTNTPVRTSEDALMIIHVPIAGITTLLTQEIKNV
jgi:hypothetical protein